MSQTTSSPETFWSSLRDNLLEVIPADTFRVWFDNIRVGRLDDDGCELITPNEFSAIIYLPFCTKPLTLELLNFLNLFRNILNIKNLRYIFYPFPFFCFTASLFAVNQCSKGVYNLNQHHNFACE